MTYRTHFEREITLEDNSTLTEYMGWRHNAEDDVQTVLRLSTLFETVYELVWVDNFHGAHLVSEKGAAPATYKGPTGPALEHIIDAYNNNDEQPLPVSPNAVSLIVSLRSGQLLMDIRTSTDESGAPISNPGKYNTPGGGMEEGETPTEALIREVSEEFGFTLRDADIGLLGTLYDPDEGRTNHVFMLVPSFEAVLEQEFENNVSGLIRAVLTLEGAGRAYLYKEDLDAAIERNEVTSIAKRMLQHFEINPRAKTSAR